MDLLKIFVPLAVFGALASKLVLDWASGKQPFWGETDAFGGSSLDCGNDGHHGGWCGDGDGGNCDGDQ